MSEFKLKIKDSTGAKREVTIMGKQLNPNAKYLIGIDKRNLSQEDASHIAKAIYSGLGIEAVICMTNVDPSDALAVFEMVEK